MPEGFPCDNLLAEPLHGALLVHSYPGREYSKQLTPITLCRSLSEYILMTFTATSRPQCSPFHTSANPPLNNALPVCSNEIGTFKDVGRSARRPQILYNALRQLSRVRDEILGLSSAWSAEVSFN